MPLSSHVPDLPALELLLDVANTGSIGAAARIHGITQQAASARLRRLEAQAGLTVLDRHPTGATLTDAGRALTAWAGRVVAAATELDDGVGALRRAGAARLRLAASMTIAEHLLPRWLVTLRAGTPSGQQPPTVTLTATNSDTVIERVREHAIDLGFIEGPRVPADVRHRPIGADQLIVVVAPQHPWATRRRPVTARVLAGTALVAREPGSGTRSFLETALRAALGPHTEIAAPAMEFATATSVKEAVRANLGPAVLSSSPSRRNFASVGSSPSRSRTCPWCANFMRSGRAAPASRRTGSRPARHRDELDVALALQACQKASDVIEGLTVRGLVERDTRNGIGHGVAMGEAVHGRAVDVQPPARLRGGHLLHEGGDVTDRDMRVAGAMAGEDLRRD